MVVHLHTCKTDLCQMCTNWLLISCCVLSWKSSIIAYVNRSNVPCASVGQQLQAAAMACAKSWSVPQKTCYSSRLKGLSPGSAGEMQAALTVVLVNNGGGGIFSFLPIADTLQPEVFTPLWATPHNVDLAGIYHAKGTGGPYHTLLCHLHRHISDTTSHVTTASVHVHVQLVAVMHVQTNNIHSQSAYSALQRLLVDRYQISRLIFNSTETFNQNAQTPVIL